MCYSGKCRWGQYMGDCGFPNNIKVRKIHPSPLCEIPMLGDEITEEYKEYLNQEHMKIKKISENE